MELFDKCEKCGKDGTSVKKVIGTFIHLKQTCNNCDHMREWDSQPFVKNIPAGNILLSASILFGGGLPSQVMFMYVTYLHTCTRTLHACTHTHHEHHIIYVYHIHTQIHTQYTRTPTDVTHSGSFRVCINLFAYLLQPSAFLFTAHCVFCLESPPVLSADSTEECSKKANFRWGWEG